MLPSITPENVAVSAAEMLGAAGVTNVAKRATPSTPDWTIHEVGFARTGKGCTTVDPRNLCGYVLSLLGGWDNGGSVLSRSMRWRASHSAPRKAGLCSKTTTRPPCSVNFPD